MRERVETTRERKLVARMQPSLAGVRNFLFNLNLLTPPSLTLPKTRGKTKTTTTTNNCTARKTLSPRPTRPWKTTLQQQQHTGTSSRARGTPARPPRPRRRRYGALRRGPAGAGWLRRQLAGRRRGELVGRNRSCSTRQRDRRGGGARSSSPRRSSRPPPSCRRCSAAATEGRGRRPSPPTSSCPSLLLARAPRCPAAGAEERPPRRPRLPSLLRSRCPSSHATRQSSASWGRWAPAPSRASSGPRTGSTGGSTRSRSRRRSFSRRRTWRGGGRRRRHWRPRARTEVGFFFPFAREGFSSGLFPVSPSLRGRVFETPPFSKKTESDSPTITSSSRRRRRIISLPRSSSGAASRGFSMEKKKEGGNSLFLTNFLFLLFLPKILFAGIVRYYGAWAERGPRGACFFLLGGSGGEMKRKRFCFFELGQSFSPQNSTLLLSQHH